MIRSGRRRRFPLEEEILEKEDHIGEIDLSTVIGVGGILAILVVGPGLEEAADDLDGIGERVVSRPNNSNPDVPARPLDREEAALVSPV